MAAIIRTGLRQAMRRVDVGNVSDPLHDAVAALESSLYAPLYAQIVKTYAEGYVSGGELIARHIRSAAILTAAAPIPAEDPRIAKATQAVVYGVRDSLKEHKNEIQATIRDGLEKGESIPKLSGRLGHYFDDNRAASTRFARTATNDIYNRAHLDRYEDSKVVDGVQYSAHLDDRTSDICMMLNGNIWALGDKDIVVPPAHFSCLVAGTQIKTIFGVQDIESVQINDMVLTRANRYMPVTNIMNHVPDELIEIRTDNRSIRVTPNHPVLVQRNKHQEWVSAGDLKEGDDVLILG